MPLYEQTYKNKDHFSFGRNWKNFLESLSDEKIKEAEDSLTSFLGGKQNIEGKTFVDIGCGSGLFSYAAFLSGAEKIVSVDIDDYSVNCVTSLWEKAGRPENWIIKKGSALDTDFILSLGTFDIVYSWGVLHHTGNMYQAFDNVTRLVGQKGSFFLAIYNRFDTPFRGGTSEFWLWVKQMYNQGGDATKSVMNFIYGSYMALMMLARLKNPFTEIRNYKSNRGMSWYHDLVDWLGGYPYEYAGPDEIVNYFGKKSFACQKMIFRNGIGCNEFLLTKIHE